MLRAADLFDVTGLRCLVTGGAGGLGTAIAAALLGNGAHVRLLDGDGARLADAVAGFGTDRASGFAVDVRDRDGLRAAIAAAAAEWGRLDVVFANCGVPAGPGFLDGAGGRDPAGAVENLPDALWDDVLGINVTGVLATIQAAAVPMKRQGSGRIIVTSSIAGLRPGAIVGTPYGVTKAAILHLVKQAALELARYDVLVNAIVPGPFRTRITTPELAERFRAGCPLGRIAEPDDLAGLVLLLSSRAGRHITGTQLVIDGGSMLGAADWGSER